MAWRRVPAEDLQASSRRTREILHIVHLALLELSRHIRSIHPCLSRVTRAQNCDQRQSQLIQMASTPSPTAQPVHTCCSQPRWDTKFITGHSSTPARSASHHRSTRRIQLISAYNTSRSIVASLTPLLALRIVVRRHVSLQARLVIYCALPSGPRRRPPEDGEQSPIAVRRGTCSPDGPEVRTHKTEPDGEKPHSQDGARRRVSHSEGVAGSEKDTHKMALTSQHSGQDPEVNARSEKNTHMMAKEGEIVSPDLQEDSAGSERVGVHALERWHWWNEFESFTQEETPDREKLAHQKKTPINESTDKTAPEKATDERARIYQRRPEDVKEEERRETLNRWQDRWDRACKGRWTHRLIPNITEWVERGHGEVDYHLTQLLTGHGYFKSHSQRYDNTLSALCPACPVTVQDAEHVFFRCSRFHEERKRLHKVLQKEIEPENIDRLMLETAGNWMAVASFAQSVVTRLRQEAQEV
ncbi:unnamed protein product [Trichogramma brassicae]|uniref:Reverse transcriptase zinc-binding domain-containing protein n=1 Tax=Trichogramma brassicae TaxID=86971 RepID=A0A6H5ICG5_9HYME|nr:unnamed protein product [Trichogramma brassicae]CAB0035067.1 unnamed protein product [Trichogramma brassicae]CAB0035069.1 unnamed protein product [Trichogramma brassicae]CAB0035071.1 unnamed protein product [Trichogramma brassicae]CAB0035073.1 unnamed protein product [Trichogramma brassicae]